MAHSTPKYETRVVAVGAQVDKFIEHSILVLFDEGAPDELADFSLLHEQATLRQELVPGDTIFIDQEPFRILAIGEVANDNLAKLGHLVIKANGQSEPEMPGDVCVEAKPLPPIKVGTVFKIIGQQ